MSLDALSTYFGQHYALRVSSLNRYLPNVELAIFKAFEDIQVVHSAKVVGGGHLDVKDGKII